MEPKGSFNRMVLEGELTAAEKELEKTKPKPEKKVSKAAKLEKELKDIEEKIIYHKKKIIVSGSTSAARKNAQKALE